MRLIRIVGASLALTWALILQAATPASSQPVPEIAYEQVAVTGGPWKVWVKPHAVDRGSYVHNFNLLEVSSPNMKVAFEGESTWCVYRIVHADHSAGSPSGGTGSVVYWDGKPVGSVHGGEVVKEVTLSVDGRVIPLVRGGKRQYDRNAKWGGSQIILSRKSVIGPFRHEARFEFGTDESSYTVTHRYEVAEAITPERFKGYRYVFMHMMPPEFGEWMRIGVDEQVSTGWVEPADANLPAKDRVVWTERVRSVVCYAQAWNMGIVYAYPEAYEGLSHFADRGRKDRKFRGILFTKDTYARGEVLEWRLRVTVFDANSDEWQGKGLLLAKTPF